MKKLILMIYLISFSCLLFSQETSTSAKSTPVAVAFIAGKYSGVVFRDDLLNCNGILLKQFDSDKDAPYVVTEFSLSAAINGDLYEKHTEGNQLRADMKELIGKIPFGSAVYIENIVAKEVGNKSSNTVRLAPITLYVIDKCK